MDVIVESDPQVESPQEGDDVRQILARERRAGRFGEEKGKQGICAQRSRQVGQPELIHAVATAVRDQSPHSHRGDGIDQHVTKLEEHRQQRTGALDDGAKGQSVKQNPIPGDPGLLQVMIANDRREPVHFPERREREDQRKNITRPGFLARERQHRRRDQHGESYWLPG